MGEGEELQEKLEGKLEGKRETAINALKLGVSLDIVIKATGLSKEEVLKLNEEVK